MKKTIYISGPITDNKTGLPREGWQEDFQEAEAKLRAMGFDVINPIDIAREAEEAWERKIIRPMDSDVPPRWFYIYSCIREMVARTEVGAMVEDITGHSATRLNGLYLIGDADGCMKSHGVQIEMHMAELIGIPVFAEFRADNEIWTDDLCIKSERTVEGLLGEQERHYTTGSKEADEIEQTWTENPTRR